MNEPEFGLSDLDILRETFVNIGITVVDGEPGAYPGDDEAVVGKARNDDGFTYLTLGKGVGHKGFECSFKFDSRGEFIEWGIWE